MAMFKKIARIVNFGSFSDFDWGVSIPNKGVEFKDVNILYGRNYSGKTTLSRIFRALEKGELPAHYSEGEFTLEVAGAKPITQNSLGGYSDRVRVFNSDFVKENLQFIHGDAKDGANSFAILGEKNADVEKQIADAESELGSVDGKSGLRWDEKLAEEAQTAAGKKYNSANTKFGKDKTAQASTIEGNRPKFGVKKDYNAPKLVEDIANINLSSYTSLDANYLKTLEKHTNDDEKPRIELPEELKVNFDDLVAKAKSLVERKVERQEPIQELLSNPDLEEWVSAGIDLHKEREECGYCRRRLTDEILTDLKNHFNQSTKELQNEIKSLLIELGKEEASVQNPLEKSEFDKAKFYSVFHDELDDARSTYTSEAKKHRSAIGELKEQLEKKSRAVSRVLIFKSPDFDVSQLREVDERLRKIIADSNAYTFDLSNTKKEAQYLLRKDLIANWMKDIDYEAKESEVAQLYADKEKAEDDLKEAQKLVAAKQHDLRRLKDSMKDESAGAKKVNELLSSHFAQYSFLLSPIENDSGKHRFEIKRGDEVAYNLSEGERNIVAFCYFIARLYESDDGKEKNKFPIIWIDDPVSSLDSSHIFFVYGLIRSEILDAERALQLFISTHNLYFLRYLKTIDAKKSKRSFFLVERPQKNSVIATMPKYLKEYATEFNYYFGQIYMYANLNEADAEFNHQLLNFPNNARKFLEIFLYYRHPNVTNDYVRLCSFFGTEETASVALTHKMTNEFSHAGRQVDNLEGLAESSLITDVPKVAGAIISAMEKHDPHQLAELIKSIGKDPNDRPSLKTALSNRGNK